MTPATIEEAQELLRRAQGRVVFLGGGTAIGAPPPHDQVLSTAALNRIVEYAPPDQVVTLVTQPLKIGISDAAVSALHALGYPIASSGVTIQIANYQLLVAAACAGLNSIISLSAICLFYVYLRHKSDWPAFLTVAALVVPVAIFSNFVRVAALILVTYYFGEAAGQGFIHDFAGLTVFLVALLTIFGADALLTGFRERRSAKA